MPRHASLIELVGHNRRALTKVEDGVRGARIDRKDLVRSGHLRKEKVDLDLDRIPSLLDLSHLSVGEPSALSAKHDAHCGLARSGQVLV